jgi:hypothetical protein
VNIWSKVLTDPLGLSGFALFVAFSTLGLLAKRKLAKKWVWLPNGVFAMACACLLAGLFLAYLQIRKAGLEPLPTTVNQQHIDQIDQQSSGSGAVNAAGVQGSVTTNNTESGEDSTKTKQKATK